MGPITQLPRSFLTCDVMCICSKHPRGVFLFPFYRWNTRGSETPTRYSRTQNHICSSHHGLRGTRPKNLVCRKDSTRLLNKHANKGKQKTSAARVRALSWDPRAHPTCCLAPLHGDGCGWGPIRGTARGPADAWVSSTVSFRGEFVGAAGQPSEGRGLVLTQQKSL